MNPLLVRGPRAALWVLATAAALGVIASLHAWSPGSDANDSLCALRSVFGLDCPTCGLTRSFAELAKGRLGAASRLHPLAGLLAAELGLVWALSGVAIVRPGWLMPRRAVIPALLGTGAALVLVWIYRLATGSLPP